MSSDRVSRSRRRKDRAIPLGRTALTRLMLSTSGRSERILPCVQIVPAPSDRASAPSRRRFLKASRAALTVATSASSSDVTCSGSSERRSPLSVGLVEPTGGAFGSLLSMTIVDGSEQPGTIGSGSRQPSS
jgi:hypothetical protein